MKVAIVTLHRVYNYGSVLQAYATQRQFEKVGFEAVVVDYITEQRTMKRDLLGQQGISWGKPRKWFYIFLRFLSILIKDMTLGRFLGKNLNLTKRYITSSDLEKDPPAADVYVTGSDQTWNSAYNEGVDRGFFLQFVPKDKMKVSFVASFGKSVLDSWEVEETKRYISEYSALSVRENTAVEILRDLGRDDAVQLIDPTLQLHRTEWMKLASKRLVKEPYLILMLLYNEDNGATECARKIADEKGLKLVKISWELNKPPMVDKLFTHRTPADFLSLFAYADFVVTNSFHGTAFAINFERQFITVPRSEYNTRIDSLLALTGLSKRLVSDTENAICISTERIDYQKVELILECERKKAVDFLESIVQRNC